MDNCIFCKIIAGVIPSATIYENDEFKVILDRFPASEGHVLVMPKEHCDNLFEIDEEKAGRLFTLAVKVAKVMKKTLGFENMNLVQNNGPIAGQTVNHLHVHLIPRCEGDEVKVTWPQMNLTDQQIEDVRAKLAENL